MPPDSCSGGIGVLPGGSRQVPDETVSRVTMPPATVAAMTNAIQSSTAAHLRVALQRPAACAGPRLFGTFFSSVEPVGCVEPRWVRSRREAQTIRASSGVLAAHRSGDRTEPFAHPATPDQPTSTANTPRIPHGDRGAHHHPAAARTGRSPAPPCQRARRPPACRGDRPRRTRRPAARFPPALVRLAAARPAAVRPVPAAVRGPARLRLVRRTGPRLRHRQQGGRRARPAGRTGPGPGPPHRARLGRLDRLPCVPPGTRADPAPPGAEHDAPLAAAPAADAPDLAGTAPAGARRVRGGYRARPAGSAGAGSGRPRRPPPSSAAAGWSCPAGWAR